MHLHSGPRATYTRANAAKPRLFRNPAKHWGVTLHDANTTFVVRCYDCLASGVVPDPDEEGRRLDRADWPVVPCMFTNGCDGVVVPEVLN